MTKTYIFPSETNNDDNKDDFATLVVTRNVKIILLIILVCFLLINNDQNFINWNNKSNYNNFTNSTNNTNYTDNFNILKIIKNNNITNLNYIINENTSIIKPIVLYYSKQYSISEKDSVLKNTANIQKIMNQIKIAKSNSIYGFGIYYYWDTGKEIFNDPLDIIIEYKILNIPFLLIYRNENKKNI